jgi:hypothetical protein
MILLSDYIQLWHCQIGFSSPPASPQGEAPRKSIWFLFRKNEPEIIRNPQFYWFSVSYRRSSEGRGESEVPSGFRCSKCAPLTWTWLGGWNMNFIFPLIDGRSSFLLTTSIIFHDGYCATHQGYIHHLWIISRSILQGCFNPN